MYLVLHSHPQFVHFSKVSQDIPDRISSISTTLAVSPLQGLISRDFIIKKARNEKELFLVCFTWSVRLNREWNFLWFAKGNCAGKDHEVDVAHHDTSQLDPAQVLLFIGRGKLKLQLYNQEILCKNQSKN